jgi:membrane-associated phospholipid phosphatase
MDEGTTAPMYALSATPLDGASEAARRPVRRRRSDLAWFAAASAVLVAACLAIDGEHVGELEERVFRWVNDAPDFLYPPWWALMQYGTFITIPLATVIALLLRRIWLAVELAVAGIGVYLIAKVVKEAVPRGRPGAVLDGARLRAIGSEGLGFPSGHAAVSAALAFVLFAYLPRAWRWAFVALGVIVSVGRLYVGAHLPLDVVGGAALGVATGALVTFVGGVTERESEAAGSPSAVHGEHDGA